MPHELPLKNRLSASYWQLDDAAAGLPSQRPSPRRNLCQGWLWEVLAAVVSVAGMGAVVVILWRMQEQPLSHWTFPININSTVAAFITAVKSLALLVVASCLGQTKWRHFGDRPSELRDFEVFDDASRGPWGAIRLLWCLRTRWGLGVLGALVTIGAVSVDALSQQVIHLDTRTEFVDSDQANFWLTHSYRGGARGRPGIISLSNPQPSSFDYRMQGAIYRGMHGIPSTTAFNCPAKCEWNASYITLGIRSRCNDVTASAFAGSQLSTNITNTDEPVSGIVRLPTPGGLVVKYDVSYTSYHTAVDVVAEQIFPEFTSGKDLQLTPKGGFDPDFAIIGVMRLKDKENEIKAFELSAEHAEVFECRLGFAAYEYSGIQADGNNLTIGRTTVHDLARGSYAKEGNQSDRGDTITFSTPGLPSFKVAAHDFAALGQFLNSSAFSGSTFDGESGPAGNQFGVPTQGMGLTLLDAGVAAPLAAAAQSMTHQLHAAGGQRRAVGGRVAVAVPFVRVRWWPWLAAPLAIDAAAVVLLIATIYAARRETLWKSSAVAALYHAVTPAGAPDAVLRPAIRHLEDLDRLGKEVRIVYDR